MAVSIIDALIVTLGLDPSGFKKGASEADSALKDTRNIAAAAADDIVGGVGKIGLAFIGLFTAIKGVEGVVDYFKDLNSTIADLGYTSRQLGESAGGLRLYQQIAEGFGGTAKGVTGSVASLETAMFNMRQMGTMSDTLVAWQRFGGGLPTMNAQGGVDYLASINQARRATAGLPDAEKAQRLKAMGLDEGSINAIMAGRSELDKWAASNKKSANEVGGNTKAAQDLERSWLQLKNDAVGLSATVLGHTTPALEAMFAAIDGWVNSQGFTGVLDHIRDSIQSIATALKDLANGDFMKSLDDLFGIGNKEDAGPGDAWIKRQRSTFISKFTQASLEPRLGAVEKQYGLPAGILGKVATAESNWDPNAVSSTGALGVFQLDPKFHTGAGQDAGADAVTAAQYLASLHRMFGGNDGDKDWSKAIEAYNVGPGALKNALTGKGKAAEDTRAAAGRYLNKVMGATASPPTASLRGPASLSVTIGTINTRATDASGLARDLNGAIQRHLNVMQTDAGMA